MATVATLLINLTAKTVLFERNIKRSRKKLNRFEKAAKASVTAVSRVFKAMGIAAAAGFGAVSVAVGKSMGKIDSIAKLSDRLGIATEDLIKLQHAAELSGVKTESLNTSIQRMVRRVGEAAQGTGEAKNALVALGVDAKKLNREGPAKALLTLADAFAKVPSQADRVRYAFKLFDTEGVAMLQMLQGGSGSVREMMAEIDKFGGAINRVDAAQVEAANDAITNLKKSTALLTDKLAVGLAPYIQYVSDLFIDMRSSGIISTNSINKGLEKTFRIANVIAKAFNVVHGILKIVSAFMGSVITIFSGLASVILDVVSAISLLVGKLLDLESVSDFAESTGNKARELEAFANELSRQNNNLAKEGLSQIFSFDDGKKTIDKIFNEVEKRRKATELKIKTRDKIGSVSESMPVSAAMKGGSIMSIDAGAVSVGSLGSSLSNNKIAQNLKANEKTAQNTTAIANTIQNVVLR